MTKRGSKSGVLFLAGWMIGILVLCCSIASAATLSISWDANTEEDLAGYQVYIDQAAPVDVGWSTYIK